MARPQTKNGYIRIANELFNELNFRDFNKLHLEIINFILRLSYGCNKKWAKIAPKSLFRLYGVNISYVYQGLKFLERNKVIKIQGDFYSLNKNYDEWKIAYKNGVDFEKLANVVAENLHQNDANIEENLHQNDASENDSLHQNDGNSCIKMMQDLHQNDASATAETIINSEIEPAVKTIKDNKDNIYINTCNNQTTKKIDPYCNSYTEKFKQIYKEIFGQTPFLLNDDLFKLTEIVSCIPDFEKNSRIALEKLKKLDFTKIDFKPNVNWLLAKNHFAAILNGEYDKFLKDTKKTAECWSLNDFQPEPYKGDDGWTL